MLGVFVAGIHLSETLMSGSFEPVQWLCMCAQTRPQLIHTNGYACVHRLDLSLYTHVI